LNRQRERIVWLMRVFLEVLVERFEVLVQLVLLEVDATASQLGLQEIAKRSFS